MAAPVMMGANGAERLGAEKFGAAANDFRARGGDGARQRPQKPAQTAGTSPVGGAAAASLAYLAAAPLIAGATILVARPLWDADIILGLMASYGAALVLFFAGVRWGVAVMRPEGPTMRSLAGAAIPFIVGLPLLAGFDAELRIGALMALMLLLLMDDLNATRRGDGAPTWYLAVRAPLTALVEVAFLIALAVAMR
ncbi:MAG: DUF3429 family protein [Pseudomonadota bacterium]